MEPLSYSPIFNEPKAHKRPIPIITIDNDEDNNEEFFSSAVKRVKNEATTEMVEDEASTSAESLKEDGEIKDELHDLNAIEVSNDADVQRLKNLIHDVLKGHSLVDDKTSAHHFDPETISVAGGSNKSNDIINAPNFVLEPTKNGNRRLIIYISNDKTLCYRFYWKKKDYTYNCRECFSVHHKTVAAKLRKDENGEDYVQMKHQHLCEPIKYTPPLPATQREIINAPNFVLETTSTRKKRLIVFVGNDETKCYKFYKKRESYHCQKCWEAYKKTVAAKVLKDENGENYVQMVHPHLCKPVNYGKQMKLNYSKIIQE